MEAGKPDEIGEVGQEAVGPLNLPRPAGGGCGQFLVFPFFWGAATFFVIGFKAPLMEAFGWSQKEVGNVAAIAQLLMVTAFSGALHWHFNRSIPPLEIARGIAENLIPTSESLQLLHRNTTRSRTIPVIALGLGCLAFAWSALESEGWSNRLFPMLGSASFGVLCWHLWRNLPDPLLFLSGDSATIRGRKISWRQVQSVEIKHQLDFSGAFTAVCLTFFDARRRKISRVWLPKDECDSMQEEAIVEFIVARLGRRFERLAPTSPDWL